MDRTSGKSPRTGGRSSLGSAHSSNDDDGAGNGQGRPVSQPSSGTSGSFYERPARRQGIIGGSPSTLARLRATSPAPRPKYSLFPRIDPPRTPMAPAITPPAAPTAAVAQMAGQPGPAHQGQPSQAAPELKSVWERSPSPPDWKRTVKGAVTKGLRQVSSSLNLRAKKSKMGLKDSPQNKGEEGESSSGAREHVPPMPPLPSNITPGFGHRINPGPTRPVTRGPESIGSTSGGQASSTSWSPSRPTAARPHNLRPPAQGRYRNLVAPGAGASSNVQPFAPAEAEGTTSAPPPPIPPRSARRPPPPEAAQNMSPNQMTFQQRLAQSSASTSDAPRQRSPGPAAPTAHFPSPRYPPPPPPPPPSPPREQQQQRGRSRSFTNLFRRARQSDEASKGSKESK